MDGSMWPLLLLQVALIALNAVFAAAEIAIVSVNDNKMAKLAKMSESRFYALYKGVFGVSPMSDLERTRVSRAELFLLSGSHSVTEAAEYAGYNNQYHFIRRFKKITGMTPGRYKNGGV